MRGPIIFLAFFVLGEGLLPTAIASRSPDLSIHVEIRRIHGPPEQSRVIRFNRESIKAQVGMRLYPGDELETKDRATVRLYSSDGSWIVVGRNSRFQVSDIRYNERNQLQWFYRLIRGAIYGIIRSEGNRSDLKVRVSSPSGTMGVRGTEFFSQVKPGRLELFTVEGEVWLSGTGRFHTDNFRRVTGGGMSQVQRGQTPAPVRAWNTDLYALLQRAGIEYRSQRLRPLAEQLGAQHPLPSEPQFETTYTCASRNMGWRRVKGQGSGLGICF